MKYVLDFQAFSVLESSNGFQKSNLEPLQKSISKGLFPLLNLNGWDKDIAIVGSAGKKKDGDLSNGVDIILLVPGIQKSASIKETLLTLKNVFDQLNLESTIDDKKEIINVDWFLDTMFVKKTVAINFIPVESLEWGKYIYHSPDYNNSESEYPGIYRNLLLIAISNVVKGRVRKFRNPWNNAQPGDLDSYDSYILNLRKGLMIQRVSHRDNGTKSDVPIPKEDKRVLSNVPLEVVRFLFGKKFRSQQVMTFEDTWKALFSKNFQHRNLQEEIIEEFKKQVISNNIPMPTVRGLK